MAKKPAPVAPVVEPVAAPVEPSWFRVHINCPTPLAHHVVYVLCRSAAEAKAAAFTVNGISGTSHDIKIDPVAPQQFGFGDDELCVSLDDKGGAFKWTWPNAN